ncbi:Fur family transcriptional regulator [Ancrocorticia populi]|uniref:Fur family transcriptional regulator n=1 Tax=Ancrocorticia populi TaxID=2175228 RepID=UPI00235246A7|nr:Fur family transcriptional regulator [Ancrocorticia populi]
MAASFAYQLREAGLKVTQTRLTTLRIVSRYGHLTVDEIHAKAEKKLGKVSRQAIYDIVHTLTEKQILRETQPAGHSKLYELSKNPNHHHLICRNCGQIEDVDCAVGYAPCLEPSDDHGFAIDEAEVYYWGLCPRCAATTEPAS